MATEFIKIKGKAKWFRHNQLDKWDKWKHVQYPSVGLELEKVRELQAAGIKNIMKKDEDGYFVTWSRPREVTRNGQAHAMGPPIVILEGHADDDQYTGGVGNGSDVETTLEVYQHAVPGGGKAKAARWYKTEITNLVPYDG